MPRTHAIDSEVLDEAREWARKIIQSEMLNDDLTFRDLTKLLVEAGVDENERNVRNKIARGEFSAAFMLLCMKVMGAKSWLVAGNEIQLRLIAFSEVQRSARGRRE